MFEQWWSFVSICRAQVQNWSLSELGELLSTMVIEHRMVLEMHIFHILKCIFSEFNLKLWVKIVFICETYIVAKSFSERLMFESQVISSYLIHFSSCQKLKQSSRSLFSQKFAANIFVKFKLHVNSLFQTPIQAQRKFSYFTIHLTM